MTKDLQKKLLKLENEGHVIKIDYGPYLDGFVTLYQGEDDDGIYFSSHVYSDVNLDDVPAHKVAVFKPIRQWQDV